eukprot:TRINITY_DN23308_c0_g1_i4.p2 TRINITY_DN23308_c0_g1~~TRINITY_DN23308_c0_g1_i4.p2  ORF type:complete len:160 (+),score=13.82 TRINITY_DN23308_c0_g1_i4:38-481(+)
MARFTKYGQKYVFGDDIPKSGGPFFLDSHLQFNDKTDDSGEKVIEVKAPMQKTEIDYWKKHFGPIPRPSAVPDPGSYAFTPLRLVARILPIPERAQVMASFVCRFSILLRNTATVDDGAAILLIACIFLTRCQSQYAFRACASNVQL